MLKKLMNGFVWGVGFSLALILIFFVAYKNFLNVKPRPAYGVDQRKAMEERIKWQELSDEEKIRTATVAVIVKYEKGEGLHMKAYVDKVLSRSDDQTLPYSVGSRVETEDYYTQDGRVLNRDGVVLMFGGNPINDLGSIFIYDDRLSAMGNMPVEVFVNKFNGI